MQIHDRAVEAATAGRRVALSLRGADRATLDRGVLLVGPQAARRIHPTRSSPRRCASSRSARALRTGRWCGCTTARRSIWRTSPFSTAASSRPATTRWRSCDSTAPPPSSRTIASSCARCRPGRPWAAGWCSTLCPRRCRDRGVQLDFLLPSRRATPPGHASCRGRSWPGRACGRRPRGGGHRADAAERTLSELARAGDLATIAGGPRAGSDRGVSPAGAEATAALVRGRHAGGVTTASGPCSRAAPGNVPTTRSWPSPRSPPPSPVPASLRWRSSWRSRAQGTLVERDGGYGVAGAGDALAPAQEALAARVGERLAAARFAPPTLASLEEELAADRRDLVMVLEVLTRRGLRCAPTGTCGSQRAAVDEARERLEEALARLSRRSPLPSTATSSRRAAVTRRRCSSFRQRRASRGVRGEARLRRTRRRRGHAAAPDAVGEARSDVADATAGAAKSDVADATAGAGAGRRRPA